MDIDPTTAPGDDPPQSFEQDISDTEDEEDFEDPLIAAMNEEDFEDPRIAAMRMLGKAAFVGTQAELREAIGNVVKLDKTLLSKGVFDEFGMLDISPPLGSKYTVLYVVVNGLFVSTTSKKETYEKIKDLVSAGADVDIGHVGVPNGEYGETPLKLAIFVEDLDAVTLLKSLGANPNVVQRVKKDTGEDGETKYETYTAVHEAAKKKKPAYIKALVESMGEPPRVNDTYEFTSGEKLTALDVARFFEAPQTETYLLSIKGAKYNYPPSLPPPDEDSDEDDTMDDGLDQEDPRGPPSVVRIHGRSFGRG